VNIELGHRFSRVAELRTLGKPAAYVIASVNTRGNTSFAGAGLSWKIIAGWIYARPEIGIVIHDGPRAGYRRAGGTRS
jgi:lipid A 3-O-deacylase